MAREKMKRYVVGDIHGCYDELDALYQEIAKDAQGEPFKIIFVGDYVDRGPKSKEVVEYIRFLEKEYGHIALMGNHEDMIIHEEYSHALATMISFGYTIPQDVRDWMKNLPKYYEDDTIIVVHAGAKPGLPMDQQTDIMLMWYRYTDNQIGDMGKRIYHGHTPRKGYVEHLVDRTNVDTGCVFDGHLTAAVVGEDGHPTKFLSVRSSYGRKDVEWED